MESAELILDEDLSGETVRTIFDGELSGRLSGAARIDTLEDPVNGTQYFAALQVTLESEATLSGSGVFLDGEPGGAGIFNSQSPGNELIFSFEVTEADTEVLRGLITVDEDNASLVQARIQKLVDGDWQNQRTFIGNGQSTALQDSLFFETGMWRIVASSPGNATILSASSTGKTLDNYLKLTITFGSDSPDLPLPEEGDFTHPLIVTPATDSPKLTLVNPAIISETSTGDGFTEVEFSADLNNTSLCPWREVLWGVRDNQTGTLSSEMLFPRSSFFNVPASSTIAAPGTQRVRIADDELPNLRAGILDGSLLTAEGAELLVFRYPIDRVAEEDDLPTAAELLDPDAVGFQVPNSDDPFFFIQKPASPQEVAIPHVEEGTLWVEWEPYYAVPPVQVTPVGTTLTTLSQNFDRFLPMWVTSASTEEGTIPEPRWTSTISGTSLSFLDIVKHGSVQHVIKSPYPSPTSNATEGELIDTQGLFPKPIPLHLDRIPFGASASLSGSVNFIPGDFVVRYEMENGSPKSFLIDLSYTAEASLILEAGLEDDGPLVSDEKTLLDVPLFSITLPGGIVFSPALEITSGVTADVTRRLTIPITSRYTIDVTVGMQDGDPYYENRSSFVPLELSAPSIFEEIGASASLFLNTELDANIGYADSLITAGPTVGAKLSADFSLNPLANPWWSTEANLELTAGVELEIAEVISIIDEEQVLQTYPIFSVDAGGPLIPPPGDRARSIPSGGEDPGIRPISDPRARWSRSILSETPSTPGGTWVVPFGDDYLAGHANATGAHIYQVDDDGRILAVQSPEPVNGFAAIDAVPLDDGSAMLLGRKSGQIELAKLDSNLLVTPVSRTNLGFIYQSL